MSAIAERPGTLTSGALFGGYRIVRWLGGGATGDVYEATQISLARPIALKVMAASMALGEEERRRFLQEGRLAARVSHPALVRVLEAGEVAGRLFLVQELVGGETLAARLEREGPMDAGEAVELIATACEGLAALHAAGIVHRDLKPANLFLDPSRGPQIGDLGFARDLAGGVQTASGLILGTPGYLAPEVISGQPAAAAADLYALGAVFFECLAGRPPHVANTPLELLRLHLTQPAPNVRRIRPELDAAFDAVLARLLAKEPSARYSDAAECGLALSRLPLPSSGNGEAHSNGQSSGPRTRRILTRAERSEPARLAPTVAMSAPRTDAKLTAPPRSPVSGPRPTATALAAVSTALIVAILAVSYGARSPESSTPRPAANTAGLPVPASAAPGPQPPARARWTPGTAVEMTAWIVAPELPGDELEPALLHALQQLRRVYLRLEAYQATARRRPARILPRQVLGTALEQWRGTLESSKQALTVLLRRARDGDPRAARRAARLLACVILAAAEVFDGASHTLRVWQTSGAPADPAIAQFWINGELLEFIRTLGSSLLQLHGVAAGWRADGAPVAWRAGRAALLTLVEKALPRPRSGAPAASDNAEAALVELAALDDAGDFVIARGLARSIRVVSTSEKGAAAMTRALQRLIRDAGDGRGRSGDALAAARELAIYDVSVQQNWLIREGAAPRESAPAEVARRRGVWIAIRDRLISRWPYDPRRTPPERASPAERLEPSDFHPDLTVRLAEIRHYVASGPGPSPPEPARP